MYFKQIYVKIVKTAFENVHAKSKSVIDMMETRTILRTISEQLLKT